ncbi:hypothetical protein C6W10_19920 [Plantactinospora sp. BB1]|nr:hypothetical protein C6W10_19920 [Plantactinospora sp. BB1]
MGVRRDRRSAVADVRAHPYPDRVGGPVPVLPDPTRTGCVPTTSRRADRFRCAPDDDRHHEGRRRPVSQPPDAVPFRVPGRTSPAELRYVYLNLRDHPRGQLQLAALVAAGFVPCLVVDEDSPLAEAGRAGQLAELNQVAGYAEPEPTSEFCRRHGIAHRTVTDHNDETTVELLRTARADLVALGDTRILKPHILALAPHGIVNVHPGYLPEVRGNHPYLWAVIHDLPQGVSVHLIDAEVDRGPLLRTRRVPIPDGIGLPDLVHLLNEECATLLVETMRQIVDGTATLIPQPGDARLTFRQARPEIRELARTMLRERATAPVAGR